MTNHLTEPFPGDPISATLFRELIRTVRACRIISGKNVSCGYGPNGTVVNCVATSSSTSKKPKDVGRFAIISKRDEEAPDEPPKKVMTNCYYDVGGKTYDMGDQNLPHGSHNNTVYVALRVVARGPSVSASIASYEDFEKLKEAQEDQGYYTHPLYAIDKNRKVIVDFRVGPGASMGEF